jgi:ABC-type multidrug transport system ATPase subunit
MYSVNDPDEAIGTALDRVGLTDRADSRAGTLSRGLLQRLDLARAVLHHPSALVLDEPDTGLDAAGRGVLQRITAEQVERGGGVVFTTHGVEFALRLASRVVVLRGGDVVLDAAAGDVTLGKVEGAIASAPAALVS